MPPEKFSNPITFSTIPDLLIALLNVLIIIATPIVIFFLIYAGFMYVTARGKVEQIQSASKALTYGVIGGVIIIGSVAITQIIRTTIDAF